MPIHYEWVVEEVDAHGDIQETTAHDTAQEALDQMNRFTLDADMHYEWCLTRDVWDVKDTAQLNSRLWCYIEDMKFIDPQFGIGVPVPKKYVQELKRLKDATP